MSYRNTAILVAILIALFGFVYFYDLRNEGGNTEPTPSQQVPLVQLSPADVGRVEIRQKESGLAITRAEAGAPWQFSVSGSSSGSNEEADQGRVDRLVSSLSSLSASRIVAEQASDLGEYGLAEPAIEVSLETQSGQHQIVRFGSTNPGGSGRYAQLDGSQKVYLVYAYVVDDASRMIADPPRPKLTPTKAPALVTPTGSDAQLPATPTP